MPQGYIKITSRPDGGAPPEIRDQWVGLILPFREKSTAVLADVVTHRKVDRVGGYEVQWADAMEALGSKNQEARDWWEENVFGFSVLIFQSSCCEVISV